MKNVLVFFNGKPVEMIKTITAVNTIKRQHVDGTEVHLRIRFVEVNYPGQGSIQLNIASDRLLTHEEIVAAAGKFLDNFSE